MDKPTLLEITQDILNDISGDEVSSINDTVESIQTAAIVRSTFFDMMTSRDWPHTRSLTVPTVSNDETLPTHINLDDSLTELIFVNYNKSKDSNKIEFGEVKYLPPDDFLRLVNQRNTSDTSTVLVVNDPSGVTLNITTNCPPRYYTSFNDVQIVLDSFDKSVENFLTASKFQIYAYFMPSWSQEDTFIPNLPIEAFPQLIEEAKSRAAVKLRQQPDQKAEQEAQRQRRWMARKDWAIAGGIRFPNYGRYPRNMQYMPHRDPTFRRDN
jgi:hypothetical protein